MIERNWNNTFNTINEIESRRGGRIVEQHFGDGSLELLSVHHANLS